MDIIALIWLCIRIRNIVKIKGYNASGWILRTIILWISAEIFGFSVSLYFQKDTIICLLSAWLCAAGSYLYLQHKALRLPDLTKTGNWKDYFDQD